MSVTTLMTPDAERIDQMPNTLTAREDLLGASTDAPIIVAGYDGSDESRIAVAMAAERAGPGGTVVPVHVTSRAPDWLGTPYYDREVEGGHHAGQALLAAIDQIDTGAAIVEPELMEGDPAEALLRVAQVRGAREIVVGSRGLGRFRAMLGSVSHALLQRADRPIVIVPRGAVDVEH
jgi:nucleotide-binding universal stress UspA family protein